MLSSTFKRVTVVTALAGALVAGAAAVPAAAASPADKAGAVTNAGAPIEPGPRTHQYLNTAEDGGPTRWDPCAPVTWKLEPGQATETQVRTLREAVDYMAGATGLNFVYMGITQAKVTDFIQADAAAVSEGMAVVVAFADPNAGNGLGPEAAGLGGFSTVNGYWAFRGVVLLDQQLMRRLSVLEQKRIYLHELGHLAGLGHAGLGHAGPSNIMDPAPATLWIRQPAGAKVSRYSANDLTGLRQVGRQAADCVGGTEDVPGMAAAPVVTPNADGSVTVTWTPTGPWARNYDLILHTADENVKEGEWRFTRLPQFTISAAELAKLQPGSTMSLWIVGVNSRGEGPANEVTIRQG